MRFWKYEFCEKCDFENVNFWNYGNYGFLPHCEWRNSEILWHFFFVNSVANNYSNFVTYLVFSGLSKCLAKFLITFFHTWFTHWTALHFVHLSSPLWLWLTSVTQQFVDQSITEMLLHKTPFVNELYGKNFSRFLPLGEQHQLSSIWCHL